MSTEATFVFRHADEPEARRFCKELLERYPFGGGGTTRIIAMATGDAMSVGDAVRAALLCRALDYGTERSEFALAMCECNNWDDCMALAAEWELQYEQGEFIDLRASGILTEGGDVEQAPGDSLSSPVREAETPNG